MAKSKIIRELVNEEISLDSALTRLIVIANDIGNEDLVKWAEQELTGYPDADELPDYRKGNGGLIVYTGINGNFQVK